MMFLLDTNSCIALLNRTSANLAKRLQRLAPSDVALCSMVKAELLFGARRSARVSENLTLLQRFFDPFVSLPFDDECAEHYGLIRADLQRIGTPIGPNDLVIAATARAYDCTLVSRNTGEFSPVVGLRVENWEVGE